MTSEQYHNIVSQNGMYLRFIPHDQQTPSICIAAVKESSLALSFVREQTPAIVNAAIAAFPSAIKYVRDRRMLVPGLMRLFNAPDQAFDPFTIVVKMLPVSYA